MPEFPPIAHVAVTVTDLKRSTRWYGELFAAEPVLDEDEQIGGFHHTVFALGGGHLFGLHTHPHAAGDTFDEHRTGLDHVAFACRDRGELQTWTARLDELGMMTRGWRCDGSLRALRNKRLAAAASRNADSRKSMVAPVESMAR